MFVEHRVQLLWRYHQKLGLSQKLQKLWIYLCIVSKKLYSSSQNVLTVNIAIEIWWRQFRASTCCLELTFGQIPYVRKTSGAATAMCIVYFPDVRIVNVKEENKRNKCANVLGLNTVRQDQWEHCCCWGLLYGHYSMVSRLQMFFFYSKEKLSWMYGMLFHAELSFPEGSSKPTRAPMNWNKKMQL